VLTTLKIPPSKAWRCLRLQLQRANATSPRIASRATTAQRIAQYNDRAAHRANTTSLQRSAHRIQYNDRASPSASRWFRFVWFVELFFLKFNIYTFLFLNIL
jgi:hypothetical protein